MKNITIKQLDDLHSMFTRLSQTDDEGWGVCPYCLKPVHYKGSHCCHLIKRGKMILRFNSINTHIGHATCNQADTSEETNKKFEDFLISEHGESIVDSLKIIQDNYKSYSRSERFELYEELKLKIYNAKLLKSFEI